MANNRTDHQSLDNSIKHSKYNSKVENNQKVLLANINMSLSCNANPLDCPTPSFHPIIF